MKCRAIHKKLIFFLEDDLPEDEMQKIREHLSRCFSCKRFAEEMKKTLAVVQTEIPAQVTPYFYTRIKARMEIQEEMEQQKSGFPIWEKVVQPALFTILLMIGVLTGVKIGSNDFSKMPVTDYKQAEVVPYLNELEDEPLESFLME